MLTAAIHVKFLDSFVTSSALDLYGQGGDSYVSSMTLAAQYITSFNFVAEDETAFQQLQGSAEANF
jgi:hypothetical protein